MKVTFEPGKPVVAGLEGACGDEQASKVLDAAVGSELVERRHG